jgi:hypothetical protein
LGSSFVRTSDNLLNESKIQARGCFTPYDLGSPRGTVKDNKTRRTVKDIKTRKLSDSNSLIKITKFIPISINVEL